MANHIKTRHSSFTGANLGIYELRDIDKLTPYARNAKNHSPEQIDALAESIRRVGFLAPVIVADDGEILAGHGRVLAAKRLGLVQVPVVRFADLTDDQRRVYRLADNRIHSMTSLDDQLLEIELADLEVLGVDFDFLGFEQSHQSGSDLAEKVDIPPLQPTTWVLVAVPTTQFAQVQALLDALPESAQVFVTAKSTREAP